MVFFHMSYFVLFVSVGIHLFGGAVCVGVEGKWCEFTERPGLFGRWVGLKVSEFMSGGVLALHRRSCWGIWCVHHFDGC